MWKESNFITYHIEVCIIEKSYALHFYIKRDKRETEKDMRVRERERHRILLSCNNLEGTNKYWPIYKSISSYKRPAAGPCHYLSSTAGELIRSFPAFGMFRILLGLGQPNNIIDVFTRCSLRPAIFQRIENVFGTNGLVRCQKEVKTLRSLSHSGGRGRGEGPLRHPFRFRYSRHASGALASRGYRVDEPRN